MVKLDCRRVFKNLRQRLDQRSISEMRNLGATCQRDLNAVGIQCAQDLIDLGPEAAFIKLIQGRIESGIPIQGLNAAYLYAMYGAIHDIDWRKIPEGKKVEFRKLAAETRASLKASTPSAKR